MTLRAACVALVLSGCAAVTTAPPSGPLEDRVAAILQHRGLGADTLSTIDDFVRRAPPPHAPALVRQWMAKPLDAVDATALFNRTVSPPLLRLVEEAGTPVRPDNRADIRNLVYDYVAALGEAQRSLRAARRGDALDEDAILRELNIEVVLPQSIGPLASAFDPLPLRRAEDRFIGATARFVAALRASAGRLRWPDKPERFDTAVGTVIIGGLADDVYPPGAALIVDAGGNDTYRRAPATGGAVSVIVDLAGDDRYEGSDIALHGLSAIVDFDGNDRYRMEGPGIAAAIAGTSLVLDFSGDDVYEAARFGQGAGTLGLGALIDLQGNDRYRVDAGGQGFGGTGGTGLLWDRAGDDTYAAAGPPDELNRGGGISNAQGCGFGLRPSQGGGTGLLRDDEGDDTYEAEMFAQGVAYWYGAGLLWDRAGNDRYRAVRYAQGTGVHLAVGVLRDEAGDDRYELSVGVGQGMGLDLSVGVLYDGAGDDLYRAPDVAQGAATANGVGLLLDAGGADRFVMTGTISRAGWGRAQWRRGRPALSLLLHGPDATFELAGKPEPRARNSLLLGGPLGDWPVEIEQD